MIIIGSFLLVSQEILSFTLLYSKEKGKLSSTPSAPIITFQWDETSPIIDDLTEFSGQENIPVSPSEATKKIIEKAMDLWNNVRGSYVELKLSINNSAKINPEDSLHTIVVKTENSLTTAAFASPQMEEGTIYDCDIVITNDSTTSEQLLYTIAHELGHCLGLGHEHTNYKSLMGYSRSDYSAKLSVDDKAGLIYLYPDTNYARDSEEIHCANTPNQTTSRELWILLLLPFIMISIFIVFQNRLAKMNKTPLTT